jgi:predicted nucleic acid-binding Zn ribbon protein
VAVARRRADRGCHVATVHHGKRHLFVQVTTNAWMNELSLLEPELLRSLNVKAGRIPVRRIRWLLGGRASD